MKIILIYHRIAVVGAVAGLVIIGIILRVMFPGEVMNFFLFYK